MIWSRNWGSRRSSWAGREVNSLASFEVRNVFLPGGRTRNMGFRNVKGWISKKDADLWTSLFLMVLSLHPFVRRLSLKWRCSESRVRLHDFWSLGCPRYACSPQIHQVPRVLQRQAGSGCRGNPLGAHRCRGRGQRPLYLPLTAPGLPGLHFPFPVILLPGLGKREMDRAGHWIGFNYLS